MDTWAATGAGAFSLSENGLYNTDAWKIFIDHLEDDGIFTVTRWHDNTNPTDTGPEIGRLVALASAALLESGIDEPSQHIAVITSESLATLMVSRSAFTEQDIANLIDTTSRLEFSTLVIPGQTS